MGRKLLKAIGCQTSPGRLKAKQLTVKGLNFLIDSGDCALNGGVGGPYLFAIYGELSHAESLALAA